ncbi:uncharacterized protein LOC144717793 [Lampetra planeri]
MVMCVLASPVFGRRVQKGPCQPIDNCWAVAGKLHKDSTRATENHLRVGLVCHDSGCRDSFEPVCSKLQLPTAIPNCPSHGRARVMQRCLKNIPSALQAYETSLQLIMSTTTSVGPEVNSILNDINDLKQLIDPQHNAQAAAVQDRELGCFLSGDLQLHGYRFHAATHAVLNSFEYLSDHVTRVLNVIYGEGAS